MLCKVSLVTLAQQNSSIQVSIMVPSIKSQYLRCAQLPPESLYSGPHTFVSWNERCERPL